MKLTGSVTLVAAALFFPLFIFREVGGVDFWWWMSANIVILLGIVAALDRRWRSELAADVRNDIFRKIAIGVLSAVFLYAVFFVGNILSRQLFNFAGAGIEGVYAFKADASPVRISLLLLCLIGPGEELFVHGRAYRFLIGGSGVVFARVEGG